MNTSYKENFKKPDQADLIVSDQEPGSIVSPDIFPSGMAQHSLHERGRKGSRRNFMKAAIGIPISGTLWAILTACSSQPDKFGSDDEDIKTFFLEAGTWKIKEIINTSVEGHSFKVVNFTDNKVNADAIQDVAGYVIRWARSTPLITYPYLKRDNPSAPNQWKVVENPTTNHILAVASPSMDNPKWAPARAHAETIYPQGKTFGFIHPIISNRDIMPGLTDISENNNALFGTELCQSVITVEGFLDHFNDPTLQLEQEITNNSSGRMGGLGSTGISGDTLRERSQGALIINPFNGKIYPPISFSPSFYEGLRVRDRFISK